MKNNKQKPIKLIVLTVEELNQSLRGNVYRNKKKYTRKIKHKDVNEQK